MKSLSFCLTVVMALSVGSVGLAQQFDNVGTSAANFLKIGVGSRSEAMGGATVASVNDATALYWNVAGIARLQQNEITLSHNNWIVDLQHEYFGAAFPISGVGTVGVSVTYLSMDDLKETTFEQPDGTGRTFSAYDAALGIGFARTLTDRFSIGVQFKYITERISQSTANAFALDFGTQYDAEYRGLKFGMSITNFGSQMQLTGRDLLLRVDPHPTAGSNPNDVIANLQTESWPLPVAFQFGVSMNAFEAESHRVTVNVDYNDARDYQPFALVGAEYSFEETFFLRGGINTRENERESQYENKVRFGLGAGVNMMIPGTTIRTKLDYSYSSMNRFKDAQRITIGFLF